MIKGLFTVNCENGDVNCVQSITFIQGYNWYRTLKGIGGWHCLLQQQR